MSKYTEELKNKLICLYNNQKTIKEIAGVYQVSRSSLYRWIQQYNEMQVLKTQNDLKALKKEVILLKRQVEKLQLENDRLKNAAFGILKETAKIKRKK